MLLTIDVGNTNGVFAVFDGDSLHAVWRNATQGERTADEYAVWLLSLMERAGLSTASIESAVIASVVPNATYQLVQLCKRHFGVTPLVVGQPGVAIGLAINVSRPEEVGADRLVNALGAQRIWAPPLIVIDFGTATTFDVVGADGSYCGGIIAPGINMSLEALHQAAAKLPRVDIQRPPEVIGGGTIAAMRSGIFYGHVALIEGMVQRIRAEYGTAMTTVCTGGLARLFADSTELIDDSDPYLTLHGLRHVHDLNC